MEVPWVYFPYSTAITEYSVYILLKNIAAEWAPPPLQKT